MTPQKITQALSRIQPHPIVVATHQRSGTHLVIDFLRKQFKECRGWKWPGEGLSWQFLRMDRLGNPRHPNMPSKALRILRRAPRTVLKTHYAMGFRHWLDTYSKMPQIKPFCDVFAGTTRVIYVYRDGRSMICSWHLFQQRNEVSARVPISDFIRQIDTQFGVSRVKAWAMHVDAWLDEPDTVVLAHEEVLKDPRGTITKLGSELGLTPLFKEPLLPKPWKSRTKRRLSRLFAFRTEGTTHMGRFKGQVPVKWKTGFTREDRAFFHEEAGDLLIRLGYEDSADWIDRSYE